MNDLYKSISNSIYEILDFKCACADKSGLISVVRIDSWLAIYCSFGFPFD